jgi:hypothetical protein
MLLSALVVDVMTTTPAGPEAVIGCVSTELYQLVFVAIASHS